SLPSVYVSHSTSGEVEVAYSAGRRKGTSAPYQRATSATSSESVELTTRSQTPACCAVAIAYASRGWPASGRTFLPGTRSEPARAGTKPITLGTAGATPRGPGSGRPAGGRRGRRPP